jgi:hypothetical protein
METEETARASDSQKGCKIKKHFDKGRQEEDAHAGIDGVGTVLCSQSFEHFSKFSI